MKRQVPMMNLGSNSQVLSYSANAVKYLPCKKPLKMQKQEAKNPIITGVGLPPRMRKGKINVLE